MTPIDPKSITGKFAAPEAQVAVAVVGAGPAGIAAARDAAGAGGSVLLVDENPVGSGLMGLDVPLLFGNRMTGAVQRPDRLVEQVFAATDGLAEAMEAGVDVRLATMAWGAFANGPNLRALPGKVVGLADEQRSWLVGFDRLVVAAGARDLVLSFPGCELPGVVGAQGLHSLLVKHEAFAGRRIVVLGSGALAVRTARLALERGLEVVALVEPRAEAQAVPEEISALRARGVAVMTGHGVQAAAGTAEGLTRLEVVPLGAGFQPVGDVVALACDTVCLAVDVVPNVELLSVLGCRIAFDGDRGGFVPVLGAEGETSVPGVFAVGDCAGLAAEPGRLEYRLDWMRALLATGGLAPLACQCEEVTRAEVLGVRPPRYLGWDADKGAARDAAALAEGGTPNPDQLKRLTRAGMGACQGRRCREQVALLLAASGGVDVARIPLATYRAPVRPLPLAVLAPQEDDAAMRDNWDTWYGIQGQWVPWREIGTEAEATFDRDNWHL